ncbi:MAG: hypothetical protein QXS68_04915 [Candidatus Methanomethylicaceae archaeon]
MNVLILAKPLTYEHYLSPVVALAWNRFGPATPQRAERSFPNLLRYLVELIQLRGTHPRKPRQPR